MKKLFRFGEKKRGPLVRIGLICLCAYVALFAMLYTGVTPEQYDIQVGAPAPIQILATKDVVDTVTTEALREAAAAAVEPSYKNAEPTVVNDVMDDLNLRFSELRTLRSALAGADVSDLSDEDIDALNDLCTFQLSREQMAVLAQTDDASFDAVLTDCSTEVREILNSTLPEGQEPAAVKSLRNDLTQRYNAQLAEIVSEVARTCIRPTMLIDEEITEQNRTRAREAVEPEVCVKGEVIVREGDIVTLAQYTMISSMGLLAEDSFDVQLLLGVALLILLAMFSIGFYLYRFNRAVLNSPKMMILLNLILVLAMALSLVMRMVHGYLMPVSLALLLVMVLIEPHLAIFVNFVLTLLISMLGSGSSMFPIILMSTICGPMIATLFKRSMLRTTTLLAGVIIGASNFLICLAVGLFTSAELNSVLINALWAAGSGVFSAMLCIGAQPLLEWLFNLATPTKLIELSNPNQPLLRRLLLEASGTYHHSIIVANLAEAACSAIGANGLLARVGAYYHDIGKLKRPMYFKENQMGDNPHDRTDPRVSTAILTAHTRDGAQMAQKARIPDAVIDIIRQHHGDAPATYFYDKAIKQYGSEQVDISAFRYEGPRPQSREAAVVMLADSIEAATRALPNPDPEKIDALIRKIVRGKQNDGQLDNCPLTFSDLDRICSAFSTVLTGVFHERIEYPTVTIPPRTEYSTSGEVSAAQEPAQPDRPSEAPSNQPQAVSAGAPAPAQSDAPQVSAQPVERPEAQKPAQPGKPAETAANQPQAVSAGAPAPAQSDAPQVSAQPVEHPEASPRPPFSSGTPVPPVAPEAEKGVGENGY